MCGGEVRNVKLVRMFRPCVNNSNLFSMFTTTVCEWLCTGVGVGGSVLQFVSEGGGKGAIRPENGFPPSLRWAMINFSFFNYLHKNTGQS